VNDRLSQLSKRIRNELIELESLSQRVIEGWNRVKRSGDEYYLDSVALNLHGFYSGLERIFELIASVVDGKKPGGENWHQELLEQMMAEIPKIRPPVISSSTCSRLNEYKGFRHVVRNVYTFKFDPIKIQRLVDELPGMVSQVRAELIAFSDFLEQEI
jgi:HepT-like protein